MCLGSMAGADSVVSLLWSQPPSISYWSWWGQVYLQGNQLSRPRWTWSLSEKRGKKVCKTYCRTMLSTHSLHIQCPLDIATFDIADVLPIATSIPVTNLRQYINSNLGYNDFKFQLLCSKIATVNSFEVAISNCLCFLSTKFYFLEPNVLWK